MRKAKSTGFGRTGANVTAAPRIWSIRWIVTALAVSLTAATVIGVGAVAERNTRRVLTSERTSRLVLEARNLALTSAGVLLSDFPELTLHPLIKEKLEKNPELSHAVVVDHTGQIQGHADPLRLGTRYEPPRDLRPASAMSANASDAMLQETGGLLVVTVPVTHASGRTLGSVVVGMSTRHLEEVIADARRQQTLVLAGFLVAGMALSFVVVSRVLKPVGALRAGIERIARGDLDTPVEVENRTELGLLAGGMNEMALALKRAQAEIVERGRLAREMELASEIQRSLLPAKRLAPHEFVVEGAQRAAAEVGGDYYDYFVLPDERIGLAIADVSGKGLAGCLVMSMLYALLRARRSMERSPASMLAVLDAQLGETLRPGEFVTMFYGILNPRTGRLTFASAGHNPTLVYRKRTDAVETLRTRGIPLGAIRGGAIRATLEDHEIDLDPGDTLLQFTDGINEAFDPSEREQFGYDRMETALRQAAPKGARDVIDRLLQSVRVWTGEGPALDDETILVVHRAARSPADVDAGPADPPLGENDPVGRYEDARARGHRLLLSAATDALAPILAWIAENPLLHGIPSADAEILITSLYEVCANVAEHGYGNATSGEIEVWWVPGGKDTDAATTSSAHEALRRGYFLIRDEGTPFSANNWKGKDFSDPRVRRHRRGLGLEIIHRAMSMVVYYPSTPVGNITWMRFAGVEAQEEVGHVGTV